MSGTDLEAVARRRIILASQIAGLERRRVGLREEYQELEVTERVLRRLGERVSPEPLMAADPPPAGRLHTLLLGGLVGGRRFVKLVRLVVERAST